MPSILLKWWSDPVASSSITIAAIAGLFAIYQLRSLPSERRRRILDSMKEQYAGTAATRGRLLREIPPYLHLAYERLNKAIDQAISESQALISASTPEEAALADLRLRHLDKLKKESVLWSAPRMGVSYTTAYEILKSEYKLRALLLIIEQLRDPDSRGAVGLSGELYSLCRGLVNSLNDFAVDYENGAFPPRTLFGLLHRSIAPTVKCLEPIIWAGSIDGRWGRRVLRLGIAAEHYNDAVKLHRSNDLTWIQNPAQSLVIHPGRTIDIYGKEMVRNDLPTTPRILPNLRLHFQELYWWTIGKLALRPGVWVWSFGGRRLKRHRKYEDRLAASARFAFTSLQNTTSPIALSFAWTAESLRHEQRRATQNRRKNHGKVAWLYIRRSRTEQ